MSSVTKQFLHILIAFLISSPIAYAKKAVVKKSILHGPAAVKCSFDRRKTCIEYGPNRHKLLLKRQIKAKGAITKANTLQLELGNRDGQIRTLQGNAKVWKNRVEFAKQRDQAYKRIQKTDKEALKRTAQRLVIVETANRRLREGANVWYKHPAFWACVGIGVGIGLTIAIVQVSRSSPATSVKSLRVPVGFAPRRPHLVRIQRSPQRLIPRATLMVIR